MIITTRKLPANGKDPARIKVTSDNGWTLTLPYESSPLENPHRAAARALCRAMRRPDDLVCIRSTPTGAAFQTSI